MKISQRIVAVVFLSLVLLIVAVPNANILATSGKLKSGSIESCNGKTYGNHGDGHWHYAVKQNSDWYPDGESLGKTNPCEAYNNQIAQQEKAKEEAAKKAAQNETARAEAAKEQARIAAQAEADRVAAAQAEAERQEQIRIEAERVEKVRLEEEARLNNTVLKSVLISGVILSDSLKNEVQLDKINTGMVELENPLAKSKISLQDATKPFAENTLIVQVVSENGQSETEYKMPVYLLGSNQDLLNQSGVSIELDSKTYSISNGIVVMDDVDAKDLTVKNYNGLYIDNVQYLKNMDVSFEKKDGEDNIYLLVLKTSELEYQIPLQVKEKESDIVSGVVGVGVIAGIATLVVKKRKKKATRV